VQTIIIALNATVGKNYFWLTVLSSVPKIHLKTLIALVFLVMLLVQHAMVLAMVSVLLAKMGFILIILQLARLVISLVGHALVQDNTTAFHVQRGTICLEVLHASENALMATIRIQIHGLVFLVQAIAENVIRRMFVWAAKSVIINHFHLLLKVYCVVNATKIVNNAIPVSQLIALNAILAFIFSILLVFWHALKAIVLLIVSASNATTLIVQSVTPIISHNALFAFKDMC
jgi:hypothetical protein